MKKREQCVFGLHFDFHAMPENCPDPIGATLREEDIREIIRAVKPDFLQIDCKGHPGWASYPSACGNAMPRFARDPLEMWRRVTREEGVALYMHYSGVIDQKYCREHPNEACLKADGTRSAQATRTNGRYVDELLIPQFKELALKYGVNGVWVDGDCWGSEVDFDPQTVSQFERETGRSLGGQLPADPSHPLYEEYREFCRELFRRYVRRYVSALHEACPGFEVASNWSYTDHMPEPVTSDVDFISGDLSPQNAFNSARYAGRAIAQQEKTWDLMSWNFRGGAGRKTHLQKHPVQIMQEAAAVIALGGGFQNYITQYRDGSPRMNEIRAMAEVSEFVRRRSPYCFRGRAIHQAAILLSTYDRHRESSGLFSRNGMEKIMGLTSLICDAGHSAEIVSEHTLEAKEYRWPVIVVPETYAGLDASTVNALLDYARDGGSLALVGGNTIRLFIESGAPIKFTGHALEGGVLTLSDGSDGDLTGTVERECLTFEVAPGGVALAEIAKWNDKDRFPAACVTRYGKGRIAHVGFDLGLAYQSERQYTLRRLIASLLSRLYEPIVSIDQVMGTLEIVCLTKDDKTMIQLVNANGSHADPTSGTEDFIPPCLDAILSIRLAHKPKSITLQPEGTKLAFTWRSGAAQVLVERIPLHEILEIEM